MTDLGHLRQTLVNVNLRSKSHYAKTALICW